MNDFYKGKVSLKEQVLFNILSKYILKYILKYQRYDE